MFLRSRQRTGSQERVASLTPFNSSSLYLRAKRPISVVHTGCATAQSVTDGDLIVCPQFRADQACFCRYLAPFGGWPVIDRIRLTVKSAGWEKRMAQLPSIHSWKCIGP